MMSSIISLFIKSMSCLVMLSALAQAQNRAAYFVSYPEINEKVEAFTNAFVRNLLPEIKQSEVKFDFSEGEDGIRRTDLAYGQIEGVFSGQASLPNSNESAALNMNFRFNFEIVNPVNRPQKYAMNFKSNGTIENSSAFTDFFLGTLVPKCQEQSKTTMNSILADVCESLSSTQMESTKTDVENAYTILVAWKAKLLEGLNRIENRNLTAFKTDFINYIDKKINISKTNNQLNLSIELSGLAAEFDEVGRNFLLETELIDYSLQNLNVQMNNEKIDFSFHVQKLHSISSINSKMSAFTALSVVIEDPINGESIGRDIRRGDDVSSAILSRASNLDLISAGATTVWGKFFGSANDVETTDEEEELGLD